MRALVSAGFRHLNDVLELFGLRLLRTNAPPRSFGLFFKHLKPLGFDVRTVVDAGIAFGTAPVYDAFPRARYFPVEPVAECRAVHSKQASSRAEQVVTSRPLETGGARRYESHRIIMPLISRGSWVKIPFFDGGALGF
jgi:hypothetical protein